MSMIGGSQRGAKAASVANGAPFAESAGAPGERAKATGHPGCCQQKSRIFAGRRGRAGTRSRTNKASGQAGPDPDLRHDATVGRRLGTHDVGAAHDGPPATLGVGVIDAVRLWRTRKRGATGLDADHALAGRPAVDHRARADPALAADAAPTDPAPAGSGRAGAGRARCAVHWPESLVQAGSSAAVRERAHHQADDETRAPEGTIHLSRSHDLGFAFKMQSRNESGCRGYGWTGTTAWKEPSASL
jgi:hypothetical protein